MYRRRISSVLLALLCLAVPFILLADDPAGPGFTVDFVQDMNSANGSYDIAWYNKNVSLGQVQILPNDYYYQHPSEWDSSPFTLVISSPLGSFKVVQIGNENNTFPITMYVRQGNTNIVPGQTSEPMIVPIPGMSSVSPTPVYSFRMDIKPHPGRPTPLRGNYYAVLRFELFKDFGLDTQRQIGEKIYNIFTQFVEPGQGGNIGVFTDLVVDRYHTASNIDIPTLQSTNGSLKVGSVSFFSNDSSDSSGYSVIISPSVNPAGKFTFTRNGGTANAIPYKVFIPNRAIGSQSYAFPVPITTKSISGVWQDSFELGITQMNYDSVSYATGEYTSTLRIELVSNN